MRPDRHCLPALWILAALLLGLLPCAQAAAPAGQWWNNSYNYRRVISIPAGTSALPSSHSVSVVFNHSAEVSQSRSLATGNDVRIVRWTGSSWTELDRIKDPETSWNTTSARIWFQTMATINANATDTNYYIYYNNPSVDTAPVSSPPATAENIFLMYDDFTTAISASRWTASGGTPAQSGGIIQLNTNAILTATSAYSFDTDAIWETRASLGSTYGDYEYWGATGTVIFILPAYLRFEADSNSHQAVTNNFLSSDQQSFTPVTPTSYQIYAFTREGSSLARFLINGSEVASLSSSAVNLRARMENNQGGKKMLYDWVRVRPYRNPDPTLAVGASETRASSIDHFTIVHDRQGINCLAETIVVHARDATNNPVANVNQLMTLNTNTGKGIWSKVTGSGTFNDGATNDGVATYTWGSSETSATFTLSYPSGTPTFDISATQTPISDDGTDGNITFSPSGFTLTSSQLSNPPPASITSFTGTQTAGSAFNIHLTAYGQTPTDAVCGVIEEYTGAKSLSIGTTYANPASGTVQATLTASSVTFTNGQAVAAVKYKDVGRVIISIANGSISGSTGQITFRPNNLAMAINYGATANPAAADATGAKFAPAGATFAVSISALDSEGTSTPNFGKESPAHSIELLTTLVAPSGGSNPTLNVVSAPTFNAGAGTGSYSWAEVGIIKLTPHITGSSYLGTGDVTGTAANVGRFYPNAFSLTANTPVFQSACGTFSYSGQSLTFSAAPLITATAKALGGTTTTNYTGAFAKVGASPLSLRNYSGLGTFSLNQAAPGPATVGTAANGAFTVLLDTASGVNVVRTAPRAPFNAAITLSVNVTDTDAVTAPAPLVTGDPVNGITFSGGAQHRHGRAAFRNATGSELLPLAVPLRTEYYLSDSAGFVNSIDDACTSAPTLSLGAYGGQLSSGETCVINGTSCAPSAPASQRLRSPAAGGDFNLWLSMPGAGNDGTVSVTASVPAWLQFDWNQATAGEENPTGVATFGIYQGSARRIYQRERVR